MIGLPAGWLKGSLQNEDENHLEKGVRCYRVIPHLHSLVLSQIVDSFCIRVCADPRSLRFLYDGNVLDLNATPEQMGMEDEDTIDAMLTQVGGVM